MNDDLFFAAMVAVAGLFFHGLYAEVFFLRRVDQKSLRFNPLSGWNRSTRLAEAMGANRMGQFWRYVKACWHFLSIDAAFSTCVLFAMAFGWIGHSPLLLKFIALQFLGYTVVWIWILAVPRWENLLLAPQWLLMALIAWLSWIGAAG